MDGASIRKLFRMFHRLRLCLRQKVKLDCLVYSDHWKGYNTLDVAGFKHRRVNHSIPFVDQKNHIKGIENFWSQAKRHMRKFNGVPKVTFELFL